MKIISVVVARPNFMKISPFTHAEQVGNNVENIRNAYWDNLVLDRHPTRPELWDGHTAGRIVSELVK